ARAARSPWPAPEHRLLEGRHRGNRSGPDVLRGPDLRPERLRQELAGEGRSPAPAGFSRGFRLSRSATARNRGAAFARLAEEVRLLEGENSAAVDLFNLRHARKVLAEFGRAFGCLPDKTDELSAEQEQFLDQAVTELAQDGKIIPVRLSLFTEMLKHRAWTLE